MVRVTVMVDESVIATVALVMSRPLVNVTLGVTAVLNWNPAGVFSTRVMLVPIPRSVLRPSAITIGPREVHAGETAFEAVSAKMLPPPVAPVMVTVASDWMQARASDRAPRHVLRDE
jgi:hypothetical protein